MELKIVSFVGYTLLFFLHSASLQPYKLDISSAEETLIRDDNPTYPALKSFQQTDKKKNNVRRITALPSGYSDFSECVGSDIRISAFKFHRTKKTWNQARLICLNEGGNLAYPECPEEGRKYHSILKYVNNGSAWIGLYDLYEEGVWLTMFDKRVDDLEYVNWADNQPDNDGDGENCAEVGEDGLWYDKQCNKELFFFCKIDL